jgi:hypothetical protein
MGFRSGALGLGAPRRLMAGLLVAALLAAVLPATASAGASANIRRSPGTSAAFTLAGSNGYTLYFKSEKGLLSVTASQQQPTQPTIAAGGKLVPGRVGPATESIYTASVSKDPSSISADLGSVGHVSLTFQPSGAKKVTKVDFSGKTEDCVGATKVVRRLGNFVGSVSFQAENGYTTAEATSVPGTVGTSPMRSCTTIPKHAPEEETLPERPTFLAVGGEAAFFASRDSGATRFTAFESEDLGDGILVFRTATAIGKPDLFPFDPSGLRASVRPPAPFSGTGVYRDTRAGSRTWSGDLSVAFLGVQRSLTGDGMVDPILKLGKKRGS